MKQSISALLFACGLVFAGNDDLRAQGQPPAPNCTEKEHFSDWNFWLGKWDVYGYPDGKILQGTNTIEKVATGCAILETWVSHNGGTGSSINFYNPGTGKWRQVWVGGGPGYMIEIEGGVDAADGSMVLKGIIQGYTRGTTTPFRGRWTPLENGDVRQFFEQYNPKTEEWATWFDGRYVRQKK